VHDQNPDSCRAELVFVDDGSTDRSAQIVYELAPQARYARQPHGGISSALNRGVALAEGDIIAFLDADDVWPPGSLKCRLAVLEADHSLGMVAGHAEQFYSPELDESFTRNYWCPEKALPGYLLGSILVRKKIFSVTGRFGPEIPAAQSFDWFVRTMDCGVSIKLIPEVVLRRRLHEHNHSHEGIQLTHYARILKASLDRRRKKHDGLAPQLPIPKSNNPGNRA